MMTFIRQLGQVTTHLVRKFWNRGAVLHGVWKFHLGCLVVFIAINFVLAFLIPKYEELFVGSIFLAFCISVLGIMFPTACYLDSVSLRKARTIIGDVDPENDSDDDDEILLGNASQPRFPYRRLPVVTVRVLIWMCRDAVAAISSARSRLADWWQEVVQEINKNA